MKLMRVILGFWIVVFLGVHIGSFGITPEAIIKQVVISILTISAIAILVSTFFRVDTIDGELCYNPNNIYWKFMSRFWDIGGQVKLCKMYWLTAATVFISYGILLVAFMTCRGFYYISTWCFVSIKTMTVSQELRCVLLSVSAAFTIVILIVAILIALQKFWKRGFEILGRIVIFLGALVLLYAGYTFLVVPVIKMIISENLVVAVGTALFVSMISVYLIVRCAFKYIPSLKNTVLGKMYLSGEEKLCPLVYACDYVPEKQNQ